MTPTRDFSNSRSLLEAHGPWACVAAVALWSPVPLIGPIMVVAGYYSFQRWWPDRGGAFWNADRLRRGLGGWWVWGSAVAAIG